VRGFKGTIDADGTVNGVYTMEKDVAVITELPVGTWTSDFRETMEKWVADGEAKEFTDLSTDQDVNIRIKGVKEALLKKALSDKLKTTNMHAFNAKGVIQKYATLQDILVEYANVRLDVYAKRKDALLKQLRSQLPYHEQIVRFIWGQLEDEPCPDLRHATAAQCDQYLEDEEYQRIDDSYDFLLRLPFRSLTKEAIASHESALKVLRTKIADLEASTPASLWIADLDAMKSKKV
jgi:DNA topoisomerase-2